MTFWVSIRIECNLADKYILEVLKKRGSIEEINLNCRFSITFIMFCSQMQTNFKEFVWLKAENNRFFKYNQLKLFLLHTNVSKACNFKETGADQWLPIFCFKEPSRSVLTLLLSMHCSYFAKLQSVLKRTTSNIDIMIS